MNYLHIFRRKPSAFTLFRRDKRLWQVVLLGIILSGALATCSWLSPGIGPEPPTMRISVPNGGYVFCATVVDIEFPDRRVIGRVSHPTEGGADALLAAMEMLDHEGLPPKRSWPEVVHFSTAGSNCYTTWGKLWNPVMLGSFGGVSFKLRQDEPMDEINMRQAILKTMFRDQFEAADKLFPDVPPPFTENSD